MPTKQDDIINRAELLQHAIATLQLQIQQIKASGHSTMQSLQPNLIPIRD